MIYNRCCEQEERRKRPGLHLLANGPSLNGQDCLISGVLSTLHGGLLRWFEAPHIGIRGISGCVFCVRAFDKQPAVDWPVWR
ncbi:unnamed protein product [Boreogadus saida]